jgi:hypothetical protein
MSQFDRVAALVTGLGLSPKVRADLFAAMRADLNEVEIGGDHIRAAGDKINRLAAAREANSALTREVVASCARIGIEIPEKGITAEAFDSQVKRERTTFTQTAALKTTLARLGLLIES